jgi:hypothetical protein
MVWMRGLAGTVIAAIVLIGCSTPAPDFVASVENERFPDSLINRTRLENDAYRRSIQQLIGQIIAAPRDESAPAGMVTDESLSLLADFDVADIDIQSLEEDPIYQSKVDGRFKQEVKVPYITLNSGTQAIQEIEIKDTAAAILNRTGLREALAGLADHAGLFDFESRDYWLIVGATLTTVRRRSFQQYEQEGGVAGPRFSYNGRIFFETGRSSIETVIFVTPRRITPGLIEQARALRDAGRMKALADADVAEEGPAADDVEIRPAGDPEDESGDPVREPTDPGAARLPTVDDVLNDWEAASASGPQPRAVVGTPPE